MMRRVLGTAVLIGGLAMSGEGRADVILSGPDADDGDYSTAALAADATGGDTASAGGLTGVSLWGLLGGANAASSTSPVYGAITTSTPAGDNGKNAILRYYLVGTNSSGAQSIVSLGEIDPNFGGTGAVPDFVAFQNTGGSLLGSPELVVPGAPGRDLTNLVSLQLLAVPATTGPGGVSDSLALSGYVTKPGTYTEADLQNDFKPVTEKANGDTYVGVPLWTFINSSGIAVPDGYVVTVGSDGYEVVLSLAELDPALGGNVADFLPYADTNGNFPGDGVARTILPNDNAHGRWESNLVEVDVLTVPEPAPLASFATGLLALGVVIRRQRRKQTQ
jgi:hypothetical protein